MDNHGFALAGELKEINIGHEDRPRLTCVSAKSDPEYKLELINLLEIVLLDEMLGLDRLTI